MAKYKVIKKCNNKIKQLKEEGNIEDSLILELAKTAVWLTKCAEYYKNKKVPQADNAKEKEKYITMVKAFYNLKLKIVKLLLKTDRVEIVFYRPDRRKHAYSNINLCDEHKAKFEEQNDDNFIQFFYHNFKEILKCENCSVEKIKNYYCLYCLTITIDNISIKLNIPYTALNGESCVDKKFEIIDEKPNEGFYSGTKSIVKGVWILEDTTFSKEELKQHYKELKEILDKKEN